MKGSFVVAAFALLASSASFAFLGFGVCNHGKEIIPSVLCYGPTVLKETTITGSVKVTGTVRAKTIIANTIEVEGDLVSNDSEINGATSIVGSLDSTNDEYKKDIKVKGSSVIINHSKMDGALLVTAIDNNQPVVQLQCGAVVVGAITFNGKPGVVQVSGGSLAQGKIVNGEMVAVKVTCNN